MCKWLSSRRQLGIAGMLIAVRHKILGLVNSWVPILERSVHILLPPLGIRLFGIILLMSTITDDF